MTDVTAADTAVLKALRRVRTPAPRRNRELFLLLFAIALSTGAMVLVQYGALGHTSTPELVLSGLLGLLALAAHVVLRLRAPAADPLVLPIAFLLTGIGIAEIYRIGLSGVQGTSATAGANQVAYAAMSILIAAVVVWFLGNYRVLYRYTYVFGLAGILLLLLPFVPFLNGGGNAQVWIRIFGFNFQPGEIAKICLAIFFAGYLVRTRESLATTGRKFLGFTFPRAREFGPIVVIWALSLIIIVIQRDLGTGLLVFGMFVVTLYVATGKTGWMLIGVLLALGAAVAASFVLEYVGWRFTNWLDAFNPEVYNRDGGSFQLVQGLFGMAHGGLFGTGLGQGRPYITPVSQSDYILPSLGEELGLVGVFAILALYLVFVGRGLRIGIAGQDDFGKLLSTALSFTLALQVFIMVGGVTRLLPLTGLTTPFLAAGGSSLLANWIIVALILRISDAVRQQPRAVIG
ncbi:FtsW/RodA/SpoVE family cell cycle protein [Microbacterium sediminis]|uniref:FtsW/RodA/SpoVE family cell cycle protein n=1 Tax=Microbacterium sediminis TaxID=904291 RepID=UPI001072E6D1|nr:FtsW/RodA/SpoVE family cell cycle protein [Microbacterium sediminis]QBR73007.1 FtsW/RodA/SpoVE family cell cycle protein [Microbacterium sediminis]